MAQKIFYKAKITVLPFIQFQGCLLFHLVGSLNFFELVANLFALIYGPDIANDKN